MPDVGRAPASLDLLDALGADDHRVRAARRRPAGRPVRAAVPRGGRRRGIPFSVQGPENALCLDGGRTIGWELAERRRPALDRVVVQVGGGALAACVGPGPRRAGVHPARTPCRPQGCAPLARAWRRAGELGLAPDAAARAGPSCMTPWDRARTRSPTGSSTTRPTTGSASFDVDAATRRVAGRRRPRRRSSRPTSSASRTGIAVSATGTRRPRRPARHPRRRSPTASGWR